MSFTLRGNPMSTCTKRVSVVAKQLGIPYEVIPVSFAQGEHKSEEYIKNVHPFGLVPVLFDGDFRITGAYSC